jgi:hypothetical protein
VKRNREAKRALRARGLERRRERIALCVDEQRRCRDWINFDEIADWCARRDNPSARRDNPFVPNEVVRIGAYDKLRDDLLAGDFEESGESQVLFLHPATSVPMTTAMTPRQAGRMTRERLRAATEIPATTHAPQSEIVRSEYLAYCWIPRRMFDRWLTRHGLPSSPPFFEPQMEGRVTATISSETAASRALAAHLRQNRQTTRDAAEAWCRQEGFNLSQRGFQFRVWPNAREAAGLSKLAAAGRKRKSVR